MGEIFDIFILVLIFIFLGVLSRYIFPKMGIPT